MFEVMVTVLMEVQTEQQNNETTVLNTTDNIIILKTELLNLAQKLGNVSKACHVMGMSRGTLYCYKLSQHQATVQKTCGLTVILQFREVL